MKVSSGRYVSSVVVLALLVVTLFGCGGTSGSSGTAPSDFPKQPIKLIVTHGVGGGVDTVARLIQSGVKDALGQPVVVENMEGAGGNIARAFVNDAAPDGYTVLISFFPSMIVGELINNGKFKTLAMTPIAQLTGKASHALYVRTGEGMKTLDDVRKASAAKTLTVAGAGSGTNDHLGFLMYQKAGLNLKYVPFNSGAESAAALMGKHVDLLVLGTTKQRTQLLQEGKMMAVATAGLLREGDSPDAPTLAELGHKGLGFTASIGIIAPPNLPQPVQKKLEQGFLKALQDPKIQQQLTTAGFTPDPLDAAIFGQQLTDIFKLVDEFKSLMK